MKSLLLSLCVLALPLFADTSLLLKSSFNAYNTAPDVKKNPNPATDGIPRELQMRMFPDVRGTDKGNAVCLRRDEYIAYPSEGNFNPAQGTVSLWVNARNWDYSTLKYFQVFFEVRAANYRFIIYKLNDHADTVAFYLKNGDRTYLACAKVGKWKRGEWHRLDAVWDKNGMKLYADAKLGGVAQQVKFTEPEKFPEKLRAAIWINYPRGWRGNPEWETAYDDIEIRDRMLSSKEIADAFHAVKPADKTVSLPLPIVTVAPVRVRAPKIDGTFSPGEWEFAAAIAPVNHLESSMSHDPIDSRVFLQYDKQNLYVAFRMNAPAAKKERTKRDDDLWLDDGMELLLKCPDGKTRQFIVNPRGAVYDALDGKKSWNAKLQVAASEQPGSWQVELAIPLADLGGAGRGAELRGNFGATSQANHLNANAWSAVTGFGKGYASPEFFGTIRLGDQEDAVRLEGMGDWRSGRLALALTGDASRKGAATYRTDAEQTGRSSGELLNHTWNAALPPGMIQIGSSVRNPAGKEVYSFTVRGEVKQPMRLSYQCEPATKTLNLLIDLAAAELAGGNKARAVISITETKDTKVLLRREVVLDKIENIVSIPFGSILSENRSFTITVTLPDQKLAAATIFRIPDMAPYRNRVAVDHSVPSPWTAVALDGDSISVMDRTYRFGNGPLPLEITSRGKKLFSASPVLSVNDRAVTWNKTVFGKNHGDYIELSSTGKAESLSFKAEGKLWFDGMYAFTVHMAPGAKNVEISSLDLRWSTPQSEARYVLAPYYRPWKNNAMRLKWNIHERSSLLWLTGIETGLAWWCESNANWTVSPDRDQIRLDRDGKEVKVDISIINRKMTLSKAAWYTMVFQGTPAKRLDTSFRNMNYLQGIPGGNYSTCGWNSRKGFYSPDNMKHYTSLEASHPKDFSRYLKSWKNKGIGMFIYSNPVHLTPLDPEYDYFFRHWKMRPGIKWSAKDEFTGVDYFNEPCCAHTGAGDWHTMQAAELLRSQPDLAGIYYDISHVAHCDNDLHGCGGVDAFGQRYGKSIALNLRDYFLRIYKLHKKYDRTLLLHAHNAFFPFVHDLADGWWPGEEQFYPFTQKPEYFYMEEIAPEEYQSGWNPEIRGVGIFIIPQNERALALLPKEMAGQRAQIAGRDAIIRATAPTLLHDFKMQGMFSREKDHPLGQLWTVLKPLRMERARFHGYWMDRPVQSASPAIRISYYTWNEPSGYHALLIAVNTTRQSAALKLLFNADFPAPGPVEYIDLLTGQVLGAHDLQSRTLAPNHYLLIGVRRSTGK